MSKAGRSSCWGARGRRRKWEKADGAAERWVVSLLQCSLQPVCRAPASQGLCATLGINDGCELKTEFQGPR